MPTQSEDDDQKYIEPVNIRSNWYYIDVRVPRFDNLDRSKPINGRCYIRVYANEEGEQYGGPIGEVRDAEEYVLLTEWTGYESSFSSEEDYYQSLSKKIESAVEELERSQSEAEYDISAAVDMVRSRIELDSDN